MSDEAITASESCFFKNATSEVKEFAKENEYWKISLQKDGILYYKGRILATERIDNCNERLMLKHLLCNCDLQAFTTSMQYSKQQNI